MDMSGLPTPISAGAAADLANRMDEKPGSHNQNLPGVEYALESIGESAGGLNCCPTSSAVGISAHTSPVCGSSEGEWLLLSVSTCVANVLTGYSAPEASIKRCAAELLPSACLETAEA